MQPSLCRACGFPLSVGECKVSCRTYTCSFKVLPHVFVAVLLCHIGIVCQIQNLGEHAVKQCVVLSRCAVAQCPLCILFQPLSQKFPFFARSLSRMVLRSPPHVCCRFCWDCLCILSANAMNVFSSASGVGMSVLSLKSHIMQESDWCSLLLLCSLCHSRVEA